MSETIGGVGNLWLEQILTADFRRNAHRRPATQHTWAIRLLDQPRVIGAIEFGLVNPAAADFHYVLDEPFWNRGLMTEAARAVLHWGLEHYPSVWRVSTAATRANLGSQRVMEKCGLRFERSVVERWSKYSEPVELCEYVMVR